MDSLVELGESLFRKKFTQHDGFGRPGATGDSKPTTRNVAHNRLFIRTSGPDAMSCVACHNHPSTGGSGDFVANVFVGAHQADPPSTSVGFEHTSERNTISIMGAGLIEQLAKEITRELWSQRDEALERAAASQTDVEVDLSAKGIRFGSLVARRDGTLDMSKIDGVDYDLVIRPFGVKGIAASIREFTIGALNQHHGIQAVERFGWERTGRRDFDLDGIEDEFSVDQLTALVLFQASLPPPSQTFSSEPAERQKERDGERVFSQIGCTECHVPSTILESSTFAEPNEFNRPGAVTPRDIGGTISFDMDTAQNGLVAAYTDFKRHVICDDQTPHFCNETIKQDNVATDQFLTAKLWDLSSSAPYGHRGDLLTIPEAILAHGGEANRSREEYSALDESARESLVAFLLTLGRE